MKKILVIAIYVVAGMALGAAITIGVSKLVCKKAEVAVPCAPAVSPVAPPVVHPAPEAEAPKAEAPVKEAPAVEVPKADAPKETEGAPQK